MDLIEGYEIFEMEDFDENRKDIIILLNDFKVISNNLIELRKKYVSLKINEVGELDKIKPEIIKLSKEFREKELEFHRLMEIVYSNYQNEL